MDNKKITVVVPIHELSEDDFSFVTTMVESINVQKVKDFKVAVVVTEAVAEEFIQKIKDLFSEDIEMSVVVNKGASDYQSQVNFYATQHLDTPYFSVLQYDDILFDNYIMQGLNHINAYPEFDMFTSIIFETDENSAFIGLSNESVWAVNHMEQFGEFDLKSAKKHNYGNYNICGSFIKSESFVEAGLLKPSIKIYHDYEFLLRMLEVGFKVYTIPKITYRHVNLRVGSIFDSLKDTDSMETKFWYDLAKKEYHFDYDREIEFTVQE